MPERLRGLWHRIRSGEDPLAFGAVVFVVTVVAGLVWFWAGARSGGVPAASAAPGSPTGGGPPSSLTAQRAEVTSTTGAPLAVHVAGAVARPGLYHVPAGSRVADALARAGGKLPRADLDRLNLAARLVDGQKILVTRRGDPLPPVEMTSAGAAGGTTGGGGEPAGEAPAEPIDLNTADLAALDSLPGIGPATARAIIEERTRRGGFRSTRDLLRVPGIGEGRFARLKDRVRV
ncbi:MAG: ComEA family DNA-binding protein [Actinomycetota bacterium]|jgi:competence protein ComEA